jgi:hypothetical protein
MCSTENFGDNVFFVLYGAVLIFSTKCGIKRASCTWFQVVGDLY